MLTQQIKRAVWEANQKSAVKLLVRADFPETGWVNFRAGTRGAIRRQGYSFIERRWAQGSPKRNLTKQEQQQAIRMLERVGFLRPDLMPAPDPRIRVQLLSDGYASVAVPRLEGRQIVTFDFHNGIPLTQSDGQRRVVQRYPALLRRAKAALRASA